MALVLLHALAAAAPFTPHHVRLLRALLKMRTLDSAPRAEAAQALRQRLPSLPVATSGLAAAETEHAVAVTLFHKPGAPSHAPPPPPPPPGAAGAHGGQQLAATVEAAEAEDVEELLLPSWLLRRLPAVAPAGRREQGAEADALQEAIGLLE